MPDMKKSPTYVGLGKGAQIRRCLIFDICVRTPTVFIIRAEGTPKYFFTIHYYLLLAKIDLKRIVKSEELIVKK